MTTSYEEAVREATDYLAEADRHLARTGRLPSIPLPADLLRALLAGPPEPTEEDLARAIYTGSWPAIDRMREQYADPAERERWMLAMTDAGVNRTPEDHIARHEKPMLETARRVQQLYRSRRA